MINLTASMIRCFKSCPRKYFFEYVEMLKPIETPEALSTGSSYHSYLEKLLKGESFEVVDLPSAMAEAFDRFIPWRTWNVKSVEEEYRVKLAPGIFLSLLSISLLRISRTRSTARGFFSMTKCRVISSRYRLCAGSR